MMDFNQALASAAGTVANSDDILGMAWSHIVLFLSGATAMGIIGNAVNTFPTPKNVYGAWLLGVIKYAVGQRITGANAFKGLQSEVTAMTENQQATLNSGTVVKIVKTNGEPSKVVEPEGEQKG